MIELAEKVKEVQKVRKVYVVTLVFLIVAISVLFHPDAVVTVLAEPGAPPDVPVKNMVTMVDIGAKACIPCKMMAPILEKLEKDYKGRAAIVFIDVRKDPHQAERFDIRVIPTQIFYDKQGKEVLRHTGFMSEEAIVTQLKEMGVN